MIRKTTSLLKEKGFKKLKGKDRDFQNNRLGIHSSFEDKDNNYVEIYKEDGYYSVYLYGRKFMRGQIPSLVCLIDNDEFKKLTNLLCKQ